MKPLRIVINWLILIAIILIVFPFRITAPVRNALHIDWHPVPLPGVWVLFFGLSIAFTWVEVLKWGSVKPFNCIKCLSGWFCLILAWLFDTPNFYLYLPGGLFVGAVFDRIKMRWL